MTKTFITNRTFLKEKNENSSKSPNLNIQLANRLSINSKIGIIACLEIAFLYIGFYLDFVILDLEFLSHILYNSSQKK